MYIPPEFVVTLHDSKIQQRRENEEDKRERKNQRKRGRER
jgi:hypothetical protein